MTCKAGELDVAAISDANQIQTIASRLRKHLQRIAERRVPTTYQELAKALGLMPPHTIHQVTEALAHLMAGDAATDRPFIAAIAISSGSDALLAMRHVPRRGPSMRRSSTPRSRSGRQRNQPAIAGNGAWAFILIRRRT